MNCAGCGRANPMGARFCGGCGTPLAPRCPACGAESQADARFCIACGSSLVARPADAAGQRKVVTIVFADLAGSTALHERLDAESTRAFMDHYYHAMQGAVEAHGGTVTQLLGDGVKAVFGIPRVAEDDALRAVRSAVEMQRAFRELVSGESRAVGELGLRVAVHTGEVVAKGDSEIIGDPVNVAARLQQEAQDGDVLIGEATQHLVAEKVTLARVGTFALKGRAEPVTAWRVVSLERPAGAAATPFVGRDEELRRLMAVYDAAVAAPATRLAVLLGSPGLGKSRVLAELARRLEGRASVLTAQCNPAGGATFAPLAEALRAHFQLEAGAGDQALRAAFDALAPPGDDAERARIALGIDALLTGAPASPEEIFVVVRRLLAALAAERPLLLAIDDLQWAEPLLLDFTEHLVQWGAGVPLLVLATARPELRDSRSSFATPGGLVSDVVTLGGLDAGAAMRLAANVIGADTLPAAVAGRVLTASEGNPLFVGELVRMLVNDGALRKEGKRWTLAVDVAELEMPPTIHALLAARIERLRPEERLLLERAAVVGRQFSRAAVTHLLPREAHADLDARLEALRRSELIEADAGWLLGEPTLRFHHVLIRDAAYRRVLRGTRAELHARFADWLEAGIGESLEHDETIGWHLEQAHQHLRELGPLDANGLDLGGRAARRLGAAGRAALARDDLEPAGNLLGRALDCLGGADPARAELALDWCEALLGAGDVGRAARAVAELGRFTAGSERLHAWHTCFTGQLAALADPKALRASAGAVAAAAETLAATGDVAGEAKAHQVHADALARLGMIGACEAALDRALAAARRVKRDRRRANAVLAGAPLAALWGPSPVTRASGRCLDVVRVLRITQGAPAVEAVALRCQAVLETLRGRSEAARRMIASSRRLVEELGITQRLLEVDTSAGLIELLEGDATAAERWLRPAYEGFRSQGLGVDAARVAALLGRALLAQDRVAEAEALSHESEALAGDDFKAAIAWRGVRAEALAGRGEHAAAVDLARAAVEIAAATDDLLDHADARSALAVALRATDRHDEADREDAHAALLWEQKGATLLVERARRGVGHVAAAERAPDARVAEPRIGRRPVRPNAATANAARLNAAIAARDADAIPALHAEGFAAVLHPIGHVLDRRETLAWWRLFFADMDAEFRVEPFAALGESLALCCQTWAGSASDDAAFSVGPYQRDVFALIEADAQRRVERLEEFAPDRLGDAVARLYERYAELLPDGPERTRAAANARLVAAWAGPLDLDRYAPALAPAVEVVDHRTLGTWSMRGAEALVENLRSWLDLADDVDRRADDVLALRADALLARWTHLGTDRASGGAYERPFILLWTLGADGLATRWELFDPDREAEALARFDEVTAEPPPVRPIRRRVRPNAATATMARTTAAIAIRDSPALAPWHSERFRVVHHPTGAVLDRQQALDWWRLSFEEDRGGGFRVVPVATLGDSLVLSRNASTGTASAGPGFDIGAYESDSFHLVEIDADARLERVEVFAADRLGNAVTRLYERYAELLPEGPERARAAATARSLATLLIVGTFDPDRHRMAVGADVEHVDRRTAGLGTLHGAEAFVRAVDALVGLSEGFVMRIGDILALRSDALLARVTSSGIDRASGGAFDRPYLWLLTFGTDGLATRIEQFNPDCDAEALARFDELTAEPPAARPMRRRVRPNAATMNAARVEAAVPARWDADALGSLLSDDAVSVDHTTGAEFDRPRMLRAWRSFLTAEDFKFAAEPLATLGESLALCRNLASARGVVRSNLDVGPYDREEIVLVEVDAEGRRRRHEVFAPDRLGDAIARLYERYAELLPEGPARVRAAATARSVAVWSGPLDLVCYAASLAPSVEAVDHRILGTWSARGPEEWMQHWRSQGELAEGFVLRDDDLLALEPHAFLVRRTYFGSDRASGGAYETSLLSLFVFGSDGLLTRSEAFDLDRGAEALARFDERTTGVPSLRIGNAATRSMDRFVAATETLDWEGIAAGTAPECRHIDRRRLMQLELDREQHLEWLRTGFEKSSRFSFEVLATRGDRLVLGRVLSVEADEDVGPSENESLGIVEVNERGERVAVVLFDADALDAAWAELDERYGATRAPILLARSLGARDWDAVAARLAPELVVEDHRRLGWEAMHGPAAYLASLQALVDLAPDARLRFDHLEESGRAALGVTLLSGTRDGGGFEDARAVVSEHDAQGRLRRLDFYDLDRLEAARARYAELVAAPRTPWVANAATRWYERLHAAWKRRDWEGSKAIAAPGFRRIDRRRMVLLDLDREEHTEFARPLFEMESRRLQWEALATRGDRLALGRHRFEGTDRDVGPSVIEWIEICEVDARGDCVALVFLDPDDLDAAYAELDERYGAARMPIPFLRALAARDWGAVAALLAPDLVHEDHRPLGHETLRGPAAYLAFLKALVDLAPDARPRADHIETSGRGGLAIATVRGTWEGGPFENTVVLVGELDARGRLRRADAYALEQLDEARARSEALGADPAEDPLAARVPPNAASAAMDRVEAACEARDWAAVRVLAAEGARFEDRRRHALVSGDADWWVANLNLEVYDSGLGRFQRRLVATAGDRVCLERTLWAGGPPGRRAEIEYLWLAEVDESGRLVAGVMFDADDSRAAMREASTRWLARDAAAAPVIRPMLEFSEGVNDRDRARIRAVLADDLVSQDRRLTGEGRVDGADAYLDTLAVLWNLSPDIHLELRFVLALERHGMVSVARTFGTLPEGGAWENWLVSVATVARGRFTRLELFELEALDAALARLAELRQDPLRIPPNAATRARDRQQQARQARDWDALADLYSPSLLFDDRRSGVRLTGDRDTLLASSRHAGNALDSRTLLATAGDRLALERVCWHEAAGDPAFEIESLTVCEVDESGRIVAQILFEPDDRRAAARELFERHARSEAGRGPPEAALELWRAFLDRDLERCRAAIPGDFVFHDHRRSGPGRVEGADAWMAWNAALLEQSPDAIPETLYYVASEEHASLSLAHTFGTLADGGEFESVFWSLWLYRDGRPVALERFEPEDLDRARARFEELRATSDPSGPAPTAA